MDYAKESLKMHYELRGKLEVTSRAAVDTKDALSLAYTPGVAAPCLEIQKDVNKSYELTRRWNTVAVVTDGTAVLGLGDIGPEAGMPVMEGKCVLFKEFGGVDAIPLCVRSKDVDDIVNTVRLLAGSFGGVNLEDISAPRCFEIEKKLKECCDIPIFHDDQHGTAVITLAGVINALKLVGKKLDEVKIVTSGAGAAGIAIIRLLISMGLKNVIMTDRNIYCIYVTGQTTDPNGGVADHAWNIVQCNGQYYYVDTTWGDPIFLGEDNGYQIPNLIAYDYLCCSEKELEKTHMISTDYVYPSCQSENLNYYQLNGMYYDTYEPGMLREVIDRSIESQEAYTIFKMSDDAVYQEVVDEMHETLMEEGAGYLGELYGLWQVSYSYSEEASLNKFIIYWFYE